MDKKLGGDIAGTQVTSTDHIIGCHAHLLRAEEEEKEGEIAQLMAFAFPSPASWRWLNTWEMVNFLFCFVLLVYAALAFPIKFFLFQCVHFLSFTLLILSLIPLLEE